MKSNRRLVLYFDINKTTIMRDSFDDLPSVHAALCDIVAKFSWGTVSIKEEGEEQKKVWTLAHEQPSTNCPEEGMINYRTFIDDTYPKIEPTEEEE